MGMVLMNNFVNWQDNAEVAVRDMLKSIAAGRKLDGGLSTMEAEDWLDDGSLIKLKVEISDEVSVL